MLQKIKKDKKIMALLITTVIAISAGAVFMGQQVADAGNEETEYDNRVLFYSTDLSDTDEDLVMVTVEDTIPPLINHPADESYEHGFGGTLKIVWTFTDSDPSHFIIYENGLQIVSGEWEEDTFTLSVGALDIGTHTFSITVYDGSGNFVIDVVVITVTAIFQQTMNFIAIAAVGGIVVLILAFIMKKRYSLKN